MSRIERPILHVKALQILLAAVQTKTHATSTSLCITHSALMLRLSLRCQERGASVDCDIASYTLSPCSRCLCRKMPYLIHKWRNAAKEEIWTKKEQHSALLCSPEHATSQRASTAKEQYGLVRATLPTNAPHMCAAPACPLHPAFPTPAPCVCSLVASLTSYTLLAAGSEYSCLSVPLPQYSAYAARSLTMPEVRKRPNAHSYPSSP